MMCAKLLKHRPPGEHARSSRTVFSAMVEWYGRKLTWVLITSDDPVRGDRHLGADRDSLYSDSEGFFPAQDTGLIQGVSEAASDSMPPWPIGNRRSRRDHQDPDVLSLSSFIGVDGNNVTLNSGRF